ncbi:hypothetical protein NDU88_000351 [Pleurodeles waltl]|uniref:Uncharacterized protein n=1 Tax=Pleurodeles waltl TaxID=8319 RepID=A0AAV7S7A1_PLEWA|nr:hypothetical protein NDU88_000351 [Pleurodeles waltl]
MRPASATARSGAQRRSLALLNGSLKKKPKRLHRPGTRETPSRTQALQEQQRAVEMAAVLSGAGSELALDLGWGGTPGDLCAAIGLGSGPDVSCGPVSRCRLPGAGLADERGLRL